MIAKFYCDTCEWAKTTKQYNQILKAWPLAKYLEIYINLVGPIIPKRFSDKKYFSTFTDGTTQKTDVLTKIEKREWFGYPKTFHAQI